MIIVKPSASSLILYRQVDHAHMAWEIAQHWQRPDAIDASTWERLVDVIAHHDDGWLSHDQAPTLDEQGSPNNFKSMPLLLHCDIWRQSIALAMDRDCLGGLLVTMYALNLYKAYGQHGEADLPFINELSQRVSQIMQQMKKCGTSDCCLVQPAKLAMLLSMFTFWDGLSLTLIKALPWQADWQYEDGRTMLHVQDPQEGVFTVSPWSMSEPSLSLTIHGLQLSQDHWDNQAGFLSDYELAEPVVTRVHLRPCEETAVK